jgi:hypothetical protein
MHDANTQILYNELRDMSHSIYKFFTNAKFRKHTISWVNEVGDENWQSENIVKAIQDLINAVLPFSKDTHVMPKLLSFAAYSYLSSNFAHYSNHENIIPLMSQTTTALNSGIITILLALAVIKFIKFVYKVGVFLNPAQDQQFLNKNFKNVIDNLPNDFKEGYKNYFKAEFYDREVIEEVPDEQEEPVQQKTLKDTMDSRVYALLYKITIELRNKAYSGEVKRLGDWRDINLASSAISSLLDKEAIPLDKVLETFNVLLSKRAAESQFGDMGGDEVDAIVKHIQGSSFAKAVVTFCGHRNIRDIKDAEADELFRDFLEIVTTGQVVARAA